MRKEISLRSSLYRHSDETKRKISESHKGKIFSEEHRQNLSKARMGVSIPKPSLKGRIPWNKGAKGVSESTRLKMSESQKARTGRTRPDLKGRIPYNKGIPLSDEVKKKISETKLKKKELLCV